MMNRSDLGVLLSNLAASLLISEQSNYLTRGFVESPVISPWVSAVLLMMSDVWQGYRKDYQRLGKEPLFPAWDLQGD